MFDEVTFGISDLSITPSSLNRLKVQYLVTIKGYNYENDITHEEVSTVIEFVKKEDKRVACHYPLLP